jgi:hypothetical protein
MVCGEGGTMVCRRGMKMCRRVTLALVAVMAMLLSMPAIGSSAELTPSGAQPVSSCVSGPVTFGLIEATSKCFQQTAPDQWQSSEAVVLNGVPLPPLPGTKLTLTGPSSSAPGGQLSVQTSLSVAGVTFASGPLTWNLPAGGAGEEKDVATLSVPAGQKLFGFAIGGSVAIKLGWEAGTNMRYAKFTGNLQLPSIFRNGPGQDAGGLTATVGLRVDSQGVHADAVKAQISNAYIGQLQIKELCLSYTAAGSTTTPCAPPRYGAQQLLTCNAPGNVSRWDGSAEVVLPTADRPAIGVWAGVQNGEFSYAGGQATNLGNSVPIADGIYLDKVGLAICVTPPPLKLKGAAGIHFGPTIAGKSAVTLDGSMTFINSRPWVLEADGGLSIYNRPIAGGFLRYASNGMIDFGFHAKFDFAGVASIGGEVTGWLQAHTPVRFSVVGKGSVCVAKKCINGDLGVSTTGAAGCFSLTSFSIPVPVKDKDWVWYKPWKVHKETRSIELRGGAGIKWSGGAPSLMGNSCDIGPYTLARSARIAADRFSIRVPSEPVLALDIHGASGAPRVEVIAPGGRRYVSTAAGVIAPGQFAAASDPATATTSLLIAHPLAGTWLVRGIGAPITGVGQAQADRPPTIDAGVGTDGDPFKRVLGYSYQPDPTHSVTFVERVGGVERDLGRASAAPCPRIAAIASRLLCGQLHFSPAAGPAGERSIYAVVSDSQGVPSGEDLVARYDAPAEPEPSRVPSVTVTRSGEALSVDWTPSSTPDPAARPAHYDVAIKLSDGRELLSVVGGGEHIASVPEVQAATSATVTVTAIRDDDTQGASNTLSLAAGAASVTG